MHSISRRGRCAMGVPSLRDSSADTDTAKAAWKVVLWTVASTTPLSGCVTATTVGVVDGAEVGAPFTVDADGAPVVAAADGLGMGAADGRAMGKEPDDEAGLTVWGVGVPGCEPVQGWRGAFPGGPTAHLHVDDAVGRDDGVRDAPGGGARRGQRHGRVGAEGCCVPGERRGGRRRVGVGGVSKHEQRRVRVTGIHQASHVADAAHGRAGR